MRAILWAAAPLVAAMAASPASWAAGEEAWRQVQEASLLKAKETGLWSEENACDPTVLREAAPLTVLFGLAKVWGEVSKAADKTGTEHPLEIHVLGASYPFEGRSDWQLLAARRPDTVTKVRIVLILGTPWQADNVPTMEEALLQRREARRHPKSGFWDLETGQMKCTGDADSAVFDKESFCRDYGNGLEVVCVEKLYQDVVQELPKPHLAVMFNPGFPQMARRTWDSVLLGLLKKKVVTFVVSEVWGSTREDILARGQVGGAWEPKENQGEDWWTSHTLERYGAKMLGIYRNPFPIFTHDEGTDEDDSAIGKDIVLHVFRGIDWNLTKIPQRLTAVSAKRRRLYLEGLDWAAMAKKGNMDLRELLSMKDSLALPVSRPYEEALSAYYASWVVDRVNELGGWKKLTASKREKLQSMGFQVSDVTGIRLHVPRRWTAKEWVWLVRSMHIIFE